VDAQKAQNAEADQQRLADLNTLQDRLADGKDARSSMVTLAKAHSSIAWGAPVVSVVVTAGFFVILAMLIFHSRLVDGEAGAMAAQVVNISLGTLGTGFATVINFWLGSSQGSRSKDTAALQMQANHATQLNNIIGTVTSVTSKIVNAPALAGAPSVLPAPGPAAAPQQDNFNACVAVTLAYEGGFVDDPADPGGATNFGITKRSLEAFLGQAVSVDDVRTMSSSTAIEIYRANYWNLLRCADMPAGIDLMVFDFGVNSGPATAAKALQGLVGATADGAIGAHTLAALGHAAPADLVDELASARLAYLRGLADVASFADGWTKRVGDVCQKAHTMAG
jgi:hypothetical protein